MTDSEFEEMNNRRYDLIVKAVDGELTFSEAAELEELQAEVSERLSGLVPFSHDELDYLEAINPWDEDDLGEYYEENPKALGFTCRQCGMATSIQWRASREEIESGGYKIAYDGRIAEAAIETTQTAACLTDIPTNKIKNMGTAF